MPELPTGTLTPTTGVGPEPPLAEGGDRPARRLGRMLTVARDNKLATAGLITTIGLTLFC